MIAWDRVEDLRAEIGADDFEEVVALFLEESDTVILHLPQSAGPLALEADLHFLKGAALNLGFSALAALCQEGERRAGRGDTRVDTQSVCDCYYASRQAFADGRRQKTAA